MRRQASLLPSLPLNPMKKLGTCTSCNGSGSVSRQVGQSSSKIECPKCGGTGKVVVRMTESGIRESRVLNEA